MRPEIAALKADPGRQLRAQKALSTALAAWQEQASVKSILAAFGRYAKGCTLAELPELAALFGDGAVQARDLVAPLIGGLTSALAVQPLGIVPLRHFTDGVTSSLLLAHESDTTLTLVAIDGPGLARRPPPTTACFTHGEEWEVVIAGRGTGRLVERGGEKLTAHPLELSAGLALGREVARETLIFDSVDGALLMLRLQRRQDTALPKRQFSLADGSLVHQASATLRESRLEIAVALIGRMGRKDAVPLLAEVARDESHGDALRWQALRECLALDTGTGFWTLTAIARAGADTLAVPAGALRAQLLETYPQLAEVELCLA